MDGVGGVFFEGGSLVSWVEEVRSFGDLVFWNGESEGDVPDLRGGFSPLPASGGLFGIFPGEFWISGVADGGDENGL